MIITPMVASKVSTNSEKDDAAGATLAPLQSELEAG
jgi:hypothetical protein